jgi:hypothetical protein
MTLKEILDLKLPILIYTPIFNGYGIYVRISKAALIDAVEHFGFSKLDASYCTNGRVYIN